MLPDTAYTFSFDSETRMIEIEGKKNAQVQVCYRIIPDLLTGTYYHLSPQLYDTNLIVRHTYYKQVPQLKRNELFGTTTIEKNGSISRGISVGNSQGVFVNSALNLQLRGDVSDDVYINAVISDQQVPLQPEGNTAQIQDFDQVYMDIIVRRLQSRAGDVLLKNPESFFSKYQRNLQGIKSKYLWSDSVSTSTFSLGLSKGKFASYRVRPIEGVQGPYRILGPNNERFIILLSNSERVYVDGQLMKRGWDNDYIIDYNKSEITFTNNVLIASYSRIRIDFEYMDRNYQRITTQAGHKQQLKKMEFQVDYYQERDNRNRPLITAISSEDQQVLSAVGDDLGNANLLNFDTTRSEDQRILYGVDTVVVEGVSLPIFVYSATNDSAFFDVNFTKVNSGEGDYILENVGLNGEVFKWVGTGLGNYTAARPVRAPQQKRMIEVAMKYQASEHLSIKTTGAFSLLDLNTYSSLDSEDNNGTAGAFDLNWTAVPSHNFANYKWSLGLHYDFTNKNFQSIDRFRYIEYERDWGNSAPSITNNHLLEARLQLKKDAGNLVAYGMNYRNNYQFFEGIQQQAKVYKEFGRLRSHTDLFLLQSRGSGNSNRWGRGKQNIVIRGHKISPGFFYDFDKNTKKSDNGEISESLMYFDRLGLFIKNGDSTKHQFSLEYNYREDKDTLQFDLNHISTIHTAKGSGSIAGKNGNKLQSIFTYRNITDVRVDEVVNNFMGRLDWDQRWFNKVLFTQLNYNAISSRELRRNFLYVQVPVGEGTHVFIDMNDDGQQQLDEFVIEEIVGNYVRVFVPSDEYMEAFSYTINYHIDYKPPRLWRTATQKWKQFLYRFSFNSAAQFNRKVNAVKLNTKLNPFSTANTSDVLALRESFRNTLFFNRSNTNFSISIVHVTNLRKQLLIQGIDSTGVERLRLNIRKSLTRQFLIEWINELSNQKSTSDYLNNNNFHIESAGFQPVIVWQPDNSLRFNVHWKYEEKTEHETKVFGRIQEYGFETRWSRTANFFAELGFSLIDISHTGNSSFSSTVAGYSMFSGLQDGRNFRWECNLRKQLRNGLQMTLRYEARKPVKGALIHLGNVQVSALF